MGTWPPSSGGSPLDSMTTNLDGGLTFPKRAFDRWSLNAKAPVTTLNGAITNVATALAVNPIVAGQTFVPTFQPNPLVVYRIIIEAEQMLVTAGQGSLNWTVVRGINGTAAVAHASGVPVFGESVTNVVCIGDSTCQATIGGCDEWPLRLSRLLGRTFAGGSGLLGAGFRPIWRSGDLTLSNGLANSASEWSVAGGAWTNVVAGTIDDKAPFGCAVTANGAANILQWTAPPNLATAAVEVVFVDKNLSGWSYSLDNGVSWISGPGSGTAVGGNDTLKRGMIPTNLPNGNIRIRAAAAGGAATTPPGILGLIHWSVNPTFGVTSGVQLHNMGKDQDFLANVCRANALGDDFAIFEGYAGSILPDLVVVGPFTNDVLINTPAQYSANLTALVNAVKPFADVMLFAYCEQGAAPRTPAAQQALRNALAGVGASLGVGVIDLYNAFSAEGDTGFAACNADGLMFDTLHASQLGNNEICARMNRALSLTAL